MAAISIALKKWFKSLKASPGIFITVACIMILLVLFAVDRILTVDTDDIYRTELESIFKPEAISRWICWDADKRDSSNWIAGEFVAYHKKLRITKAHEPEVWNISQEHEITHPVLYDGRSGGHFFKGGFATVSAKIKIERNRIHFIEKPKITSTKGLYLGDGVEELINLLYFKDGVGIDIEQ